MLLCSAQRLYGTFITSTAVGLIRINSFTASISTVFSHDSVK